MTTSSTVIVIVAVNDNVHGAVVLSFRHSYCVSSPGSFNENTTSARRPTTFGPSQIQHKPTDLSLNWQSYIHQSPSTYITRIIILILPSNGSPERYKDQSTNILIILSGPSFSLHVEWIKQRSSLVNPTIVTKLLFVRMKTKLVYISRWRTTSFDGNDTWVNKKCKYSVSKRNETRIPKGCHFLAHPVIL